MGNKVSWDDKKLCTVWAQQTTVVLFKVYLNFFIFCRSFSMKDTGYGRLFVYFRIVKCIITGYIVRCIWPESYTGTEIILKEIIKDKHNV